MFGVYIKNANTTIRVHKSASNNSLPVVQEYTFTIPHFLYTKASLV